MRSPRGWVRICRSVKRGFGSAELPLFPGGNFDRYRPNSAGQSFVVEYVTLLAVTAVHLNLVFVSGVGIDLARDFACGPVVPAVSAASRNGTPVKRHGFGRRGLNRYAGNRFSISPNDRITEVVPAVKVSVLVVWSNHLRVVTEGVLVEPSE